MYKDVSRPNKKVVKSTVGHPLVISYNLYDILKALNEYEQKQKLGLFDHRHKKWTFNRLAIFCNVSQVVIDKIRFAEGDTCIYRNLQTVSHCIDKLLHVPGCTPALLLEHNKENEKRDEHSRAVQEHRSKQ